MSHEEQFITCPLHDAARQCPHHPAVLWGARRITYAQLDRYVNSALRAFKERGLTAGQRVALLCDNSVEYLIALLGLWRLGAVACPINPKFPSRLVGSLLTELKVRSAVIDRSFLNTGAKLACQQIEISDLIVYDAKDVLSSSLGTNTLRYDQEAAVILTSGSTAMPKAAVLTYGNLYFNALGSNECIALDQTSVWLLSLPLFHVSGLGIVMRCLLARSAVVVAAREDAARLMAGGKVTHVSMVATQLQRWLDDPDFKTPKGLKALLLGGSALPKNLLRAALDRDLPVYVSYGLTEMSSQVATGRLINAEQSPAKVLSFRELKVDSDGEICVRGKTLFKGYLRGDAVRLPLDDSGWFHTADMGSLDADGCLSVLGRKDNMFISGGENIFPEEVEAAVSKIKGVMQVVVVPKEDSKFGHRPVAFIRWVDGAARLDEAVLKERLKRELPRFKIPDAFYPWPQDVERESLKIDRSRFKEIVRRT